MLNCPQRTSPVLFTVLLAVFVSGCGVTLSPNKRKPLQVSKLEASIIPKSNKYVFRFESTLPGVNLTETVWDNVVGPVADPVESKQIGFTQNYRAFIPATAIGGAAAGSYVGTRPEYTRIVIPFGRIFQEVLESGIRSIYTNSSVYSNTLPITVSSSHHALSPVVSIKVNQFKVWENPLNHLNFFALVECRAYRTTSDNQTVYSYDSRQQITNQSLGSVMTTSTGFIKEMNKVSNSFAERIASDILEKLHENLPD
jgi:hypothetical protein